MENVSVMIDIETLDVLPSSVVLSVGLVTFSEFNYNEPKNKKHLVLNIEEQQNRTQSESTLAFWEKQDPEIKAAAFSGDKLSVKEALFQILEYFDDIRETNHIDLVWGQGYGFDMTILESLFRENLLTPPWKFNQTRDSRTLFGLLKTDPRPKESFKTLHRADEDAYWQAIGVQLAYAELGITKELS